MTLPNHAQRLILKGLADGIPYEDIAAAIHVSLRTLHREIAKLKALTSTQTLPSLVARAISLGWVETVPCEGPRLASVGRRARAS